MLLIFFLIEVLIRPVLSTHNDNILCLHKYNEKRELIEKEETCFYQNKTENIVKYT